MKHYVGIDLGTTNSAICSYDGKTVRIWKSPEQNDVTPSVIYIDRRGNRYYGKKAYDQAPTHPSDSAMLFKRFMGTTTKIQMKASGLELTPEECSAEILKVLYGYLPEEIRDDPETATVITVPAAFNQMKKDATLQAAKMAGIGKVALMQEPVAAIMSIMKNAQKEGIFLVYDLGGGTFDVSIAENINGKVNLLAHGGVEVCGGRDIDRKLFNQVVVPWVKQTFTLPDDFLANEKYKKFCRIAQRAVEDAKIELSAMETTKIVRYEDESGTTDENGNEMYLDINLDRHILNEIIGNLIQETVEATRETLKKAGLTANDVERIVFIGGPTNYKPLRDKVSYELSLPADIDVNPMTAVAEGASIFAESIDWSSEKHHRKTSNNVASTTINLQLKYTARTTSDRAKVMCILGKPLNGYTISLTSLDTGWSSGVAVLSDRMMIDLPLTQNGDNKFAISVCDSFGREQNIGLHELTITKTMATIASIPASHSIGIQMMEKLGGPSVLEYLVNEGDSLPKKGSIVVRAGQTLKAGTNSSINIKLWEGTIQNPIEDNRYIGVLKITGTDFDSGVIPTGAEIECDYEVSDSGAITLEVSIPCIGATFNNRNFYSRQEGQIDLTDVDGVAEEARRVLDRIQVMESKINDPQLAAAHQKAETAANIDSQPNCDIEEVQKTNDELLQLKKLINQIRQKNLKTMRQMDLDSCEKYFEKTVRQYATPAEAQTFDNLTRTAQNSIDRNDTDFENILSNMWSKILDVLMRQDWFIIDWYRDDIASPYKYRDRNRFAELKQIGDKALANDDIKTLRQVLYELGKIRVRNDSGESMFDIVNIIKG